MSEAKAHLVDMRRKKAREMVPGKRLRNLHRQAETELPLKVWAREKSKDLFNTWMAGKKGK